MADVQSVRTPLSVSSSESEMWPAVPRHPLPPNMPDSSMMEKLVQDLQVFESALLHTKLQACGLASLIDDRWSMEQIWKIFMAKSAMQIHARDLHRAEPKPHQCNQCFKSFSSNHQLVQHIRVHTGEKPYRCSYCDRRFKQLSHVQQHTRLHTGERPYKCHVPECGRAFIQLSNLQQHLRNHDAQQERAKNRPFQCHVCGKGFATESSLRTHASKQHAALIGAPTSTACPLCQRVFTTTEALIEHMAVHKDGSSSSSSNPPLSQVDSPGTNLMTIFPPLMQHDESKPAERQPDQIQENVQIAIEQSEMETEQQPTQKLLPGPSTSEPALPPSEPTPEPINPPEQIQAPPPTSLFQNPFTLPRPIGGVNNMLQCNPPPPGIMSPQGGMDSWAYGIRRRTATHACPVCGKHYVNEGSLRKHLASHPETAPFTAALRMWPCTVCPAVFPFEAGLLSHMEQMRMDSKHQFAAQYMLSRVAAERKFMERESPTNHMSNPLLRPDVLSSIMQPGASTSGAASHEQAVLRSPPTSPTQAATEPSTSHSHQPQQATIQPGFNQLQSPEPHRSTSGGSVGPTYSGNQSSMNCGTETEDEEDITDPVPHASEPMRKMQAVNMEAVLRFAAATASGSGMGMPLGPGPSTSYADTRLEHALRLHQALGFTLPQHHPAYLQQQFSYQHHNQHHYGPMGQNMGHLGQPSHWPHLQGMNPHQPHSSN